MTAPPPPGEKDISQHVWGIDAARALCFSAEDKAMIREEIGPRPPPGGV